jgi:predicted dehydrogenase
MDKIRWGIIGPGSIAHNFADALKQSYSGELISIASKTSSKLEEFGNKYQITKEFRFNDYDALLENENIDAVYISTPHVFHADLSIRAAGKGKHILCEKPGAVNFVEASRVIEKIKEAGVFYKEGFMYRCHPQIPALINIIKQNTIGNIKHITSSFGFDMQKVIPDHRLFDKKLAGGAILDVGLYPVSLSRILAGAAVGKKFINPISISAKARIGETGVDEISSATLTFEDNIIAEVSTSIMQNMDNNAVIEGSIGKIIIDNPWMPGKDGGPYNTKIRVIKNSTEKIQEFKGPEHLFFFEAELASQTISKQRTEVPYPGMTWDDTLGNIKVLDMWRKEIGYHLKGD